MKPYNIPFNIPPLTGNEEQYVLQAMKSLKMSGDGEFTQHCQTWFENETGCLKSLLTPSCTHALEMAALLIGIQPDDEVIMPSYTFVSTANAFVLRGARMVFVDIRPDTMNIDEQKIEQAITNKTKAIVPVHYAGVACEMDTILAIAEKYNLFVIEDAAQGMMSTYKGKPLGTMGHLGTYSFHETKNYTSGGEGGLLLINDERFINRAEIIREKGTNRSLFFRGMVDKYSWVDIGSSYLPCELQAAYLWGQIKEANKIKHARLDCWQYYYDQLYPLVKKSYIQLPTIPDGCSHNAHMLYLKLSNIKERTALLDFLKKNSILSVFHYVPLHSSDAGKVFGHFSGADNYTTKESEKLIRLPLYYGLRRKDADHVISTIMDYFS